MKIYTALDTALALPYAALVPAVRQAALELAAGTIHAPGRQITAIGNHGVLLGMPAIGHDLGVTKIITVHTDNARHGLPVIQGEVIVFEAATGRRLMLLDGPTVTARRTAAVTLLGIDALAPAAPKAAMIIGVGVQAHAHADALIAYFGVSSLYIVGRDAAKAERFCVALRAQYPHVAVTALATQTLENRLPAIDVLIALTTATTPVIPNHVEPHVLVVGAGAFRPDMAEFPAALLHSRSIVVDDLDGAQHEAGDLIQAQVDWHTVRPLSDYLADDAVRPLVAPVFKTVGQAAWDLAAARVAAAVGPH